MFSIYEHISFFIQTFVIIYLFIDIIINIFIKIMNFLCLIKFLKLIFTLMVILLSAILLLCFYGHYSAPRSAINYYHKFLMLVVLLMWWWVLCYRQRCYCDDLLRCEVDSVLVAVGFWGASRILGWLAVIVACSDH